MADYVSHFLMAEEVLKNLDGEVKKLIERNSSAYYLGTQGPDFIFYKKAEKFDKLKKIGDKLHLEDINKTLNYMLNFAKSQNSYEKEILLAYACGYVLHYDLDKLLHKYVGSVTGSLFGLPHEKYKTHNLIQHYKLEAEIDAQLYYYFKGEQIYKFKKYFDKFHNIETVGIVITMWVNLIKEFYGVETRFFEIQSIIKDMFKNRKLLLNKPLIVFIKPLMIFLNKKMITAHVYPKVKTKPYPDALNIFNKAKIEGINDINLLHAGKGIGGGLKMVEGLSV